MASVPKVQSGAARQDLYRRLAADSECVLFSFSDRPGQDALGLWRERRG